MPRRTLIDFYTDLASTSGEFVVYDDGYRSWSYSYADVANAARAFAQRLRTSGIGKGDAITIWSENRAEWIIADYFSGRYVYFWLTLILSATSDQWCATNVIRHGLCPMLRGARVASKPAAPSFAIISSSR